MYVGILWEMTWDPVGSYGMPLGTAELELLAWNTAVDSVDPEDFFGFTGNVVTNYCSGSHFYTRMGPGRHEP